MRWRACAALISHATTVGRDHILSFVFPMTISPHGVLGSDQIIAVFNQVDRHINPASMVSEAELEFCYTECCDRSFKQATSGGLC